MTKTMIGLIFFLITSTPVSPATYQNESGSFVLSTKTKADWSYSGETGPSKWHELSEEFVLCKEGNEQSPINLPSKTLNLEEADFSTDIHYEPSIVEVRNTGHVLQINISGNDNFMTIKGTRYYLTQVHSHSPSEHQLDGNTYPIELHFVHKSKDGKLAVIGLFVQKGKRNLALTQVVNSLPTNEKEEIIIKEKVDLNKIIPMTSDQYFYKGSLTTPPCTENVNWLIFKQSIEMSVNQINAFTEIYEDNNRPIQPLNSREIFLLKTDQ